MREIKFRAWQHHKGNSDNGWMTFYKIEQERLPKVILVDCKENNTQIDPGRNFVNERKDQMDFALMQYTGLKDKNGKEIYEGDIVRTDDYLGVVNHRTDWFIDTTKKDEDTDYKSIDKIWALKKIEIIGNIYENPELLDNE